MRLYALAALAAAGAALDWVQVDDAGAAVATHTAATPPSHLTKTAAYVLLLPTGTAATGDDDNTLLATATATVTSTGTAPVASATGLGRAGAFLACPQGSGSGGMTIGLTARDDDNGGVVIVVPEDGSSPFCQPANGAQLQPGGTYYITWDPSTLPNNITNAAVTATYASTGNSDNGLRVAIDPAAGFYAWTVPDSLLADDDKDDDDQTHHRLAVAWSLVYEVPMGAGRTHHSVLVGGPVVVVTDRVVVPRKRRVNAAAIAVPVVVGTLFLAATLAVCVCTYRHEGRVPVPLVGGLVARRTSSFAAKGYRGGRGDVRSVGISSPRHVYDPESGGPPFSWPPPRVNVFREELKRQEEEEEEERRRREEARR